MPGFLQKKNAALKITTNSKAQIYLNNEQLGETPFESKELKADTYQVKLVPESQEMSEWETSVVLHSGITTVIMYNFSQNRQNASGAILTLEPLTSKDAIELAVVSLPDSASVKLDDQPKGFTPLQVKNISSGDHTLLLSAPGYQQYQIQIKTPTGYKLTVEVQLAQESLEPEASTPSAEEETPADNKSDKEKDKTEATVDLSPPKSASPSATLEKPYVEILDTPTGWLRVRSEPTTAKDNEIAKLDPGDTYPFLEVNDTGWYKILLEDKTEGWISGAYAKLYQ